MQVNTVRYGTCKTDIISRQLQIEIKPQLSKFCIFQQVAEHI